MKRNLTLGVKHLSTFDLLCC